MSAGSEIYRHEDLLQLDHRTSRFWNRNSIRWWIRPESVNQRSPYRFQRPQLGLGQFWTSFCSSKYVGVGNVIPMKLPVKNPESPLKF